MALTPVALKSNVFMTLDDAKDWLGIPLANTSCDRKITQLINAATDKVEQYIDGPALTGRYVTTRDGNSSNVIVPEFWPVRSIEEIRIDYNRAFGNPPIEAENLVLRGTPEMNNTAGNFAVSLRGTDVVLRDDNNTSILGRIFAGSVIGSIRVTYTAGWGTSQATLPADLVLATFLLLEYYHTLQSQKYMNIKSKTNGDQSFSRDVGIPAEIKDLLDEYKDYTLGLAVVPQKNTFTV